MLKKVKILGISLAMLASAFAVTAQAGMPDGNYIVVFDNQANENAEAAKLRSQGANINFTYSTVFKGIAGSFNSAQLEALQKNPRVRYIEKDAEVTSNFDQPKPTWGLDRIDERDLPLDANYNYSTKASNVYAFVIDTGIYSKHTDFGGRVQSGYTAILDGKGTEDCNGHGTHVSGTIGGSTYGVAKEIKLVPVRVLNCRGSGTNSGVIAGVNWVAANYKTYGNLAVANMSLGGGFSQALNDAVTALVDAGVTLAVAAGNDGKDATNYSPASADKVITVGATDGGDVKASWSNFGSKLEIFAPGVNITSDWINSGKTVNTINTISGTSMASPHVAGVAALYLSLNPTYSPAQVLNAILTNATPNKVTSLGTGSPNKLLASNVVPALP